MAQEREEKKIHLSRRSGASQSVEEQFEFLTRKMAQSPWSSELSATK
jgi:hypothetical protein